MSDKTLTRCIQTVEDWRCGSNENLDSSAKRDAQFRFLGFGQELFRCLTKSPTMGDQSRKPKFYWDLGIMRALMSIDLLFDEKLPQKDEQGGR